MKIRLALFLGLATGLLAPGSGRAEGTGTIPLDVTGVPRLAYRPGTARLSAASVEGPFDRSGWIVRVAAPLPAGQRVDRRAAATFAHLPSPAVAAGRVIVSGGFGSMDLLAFEAGSGRRAWTSRFAVNGASAPAVTPGRVVTGTESCTACGVDPRSGATTWSNLLGPSILNMPAVSGDTVYLCTQDETGAHVSFGLRLGDGKTLFRLPLESEVITSPVCAEGCVFVATQGGTVLCVESRGRVRWQRRLGAASAPFWHDGRLYFAAGSWSSPVVLAVDPLDGQIVWTSTAPAEEGEEADGGGAPRTVARPRTAPAPEPRASMNGWADDPPRPVVSGDLVVLAAGRDFVALDRRTGRPRRHLRLPAGRAFSAPPAVLGQSLLYATLDGLLLEIRPDVGEYFRAVETGLCVSSQPVAAGGRVFLTGGGCLLAIPWGEPGDPEWPQWGGTAARAAE
jgi:outer membrane protein assembly factor BamB